MDTLFTFLVEHIAAEPDPAVALHALDKRAMLAERRGRPVWADRIRDIACAVEDRIGQAMPCPAAITQENPAVRRDDIARIASSLRPGFLRARLESLAGCLP